MLLLPSQLLQMSPAFRTLCYNVFAKKKQHNASGICQRWIRDEAGKMVRQGRYLRCDHGLSLLVHDHKTGMSSLSYQNRDALLHHRHERVSSVRHWLNVRMRHRLKDAEFELEFGTNVDERALVFRAVAVPGCREDCGAKLALLNDEL